MTTIVPADIVFLLSAPQAGGGYQSGGVAGNSLGRFCSFTPIPSPSMDNLFLDITGPQNAALQVDYQCFFVLNNTASGSPMINAVVWLPASQDIAGGATQMIALDNYGVTPKGQAGAQAAVTGSSIQPPSGTSAFIGDSASMTGGLPVGTVPPGCVFAVWVQRTATNSAPFGNDGFTAQVSFSTFA